MERAQTISGYLAARGLGSPERRVRLRRRLELEPGVATAASLCLTEGGAWIVAATSPERGLHVNVLERSDLRFRRGRLFDELVLGSDRFLVAPGHGDEAAEIVGIARLRARGRRCVLPEQLPRHVDARSELERCYLEVALAPDEVVLAWLPSCTSWRLESPIDAGGSIDAPLRLLVTERRVVLVALSALGDVRELGIEPAPIRVTHGRKRITLHVHEHEWRADSHHTLYEEISEITARSAPERLREAARTNYLSRESGAARLEVARSLLTAASDKDDPIAPFVRRMVAFDTGEALATLPDIEGTLDAFRATNPHRLTLADVWERWQLSPLAAMALVSRLRELPGSDPWVLELHARARDARVSQSDSGATSALIDIALAEHFLAAGERSRARRLLEARLNALPDERLEDLLPPRDADLTAGAGGQVLRIRIHELIASLEPGVAVTATGSVAELARLQPLVHTRVERLAHEASDDLALRASAVLDLLEPGGIRLENLAADPLEQRGRVLSGELIGGPLKHPLARDGDALLGKLQALLALVPSPDPGVLMDYCERLSKSPDSHAAAALARAARILDITKVEAYVSRGSKGVGVRAYEHGPPFVLIGGRHLDPDDEYAMTPLELCFALSSRTYASATRG
jgi:hypothetical protein